MQYSFSSLRGVISKVVRNTKLQDASFIPDIHEWLYEAMEMLYVEQSLVGASQKLQIHFHKAKLPCGLVWLDAVEYGGFRLPEGGGVRPAAAHKSFPATADAALFTTNVTTVESVENHVNYITKLEQVNLLPCNPNQYYFTEGGVLSTSFENGEITVYYRTVATDEDGFPLIPDNVNYKQALYWYTRAMMIGAGYEDKQFSFDKCMAYFEQVYGPRAIAELRLPSPDQMERRVNNFVRFLPNSGYYESFFDGGSREKMYDF